MNLVPIPRSGIGVVFIVMIFVISAFGALIFHASDLAFSEVLQDDYYLHMTWFSFYQAGLSTLLSVIPALPVAVALNRRQFPGRQLLLKLFSVTLVMPVLVGVFGLLAIYGHSGLAAKIYQFSGLEFSFSVYGLNGILLAHVFFNLPYASRLFLHVLDMIPPQHDQLALHLGMGAWSRFRLIEWPRLRQQLPHIAGLVFMLCFTSFATVMALGGGPQATTIELGIYQAIKFDFDLQSGAVLAIWQVLLCSTLSYGVQRMSRTIPVRTSGSFSREFVFRDSLSSRLWDWSWITLCLLLVLPPLVMVCLSGLNAHLSGVLFSLSFWSAVKDSVCVAFIAAGLSVIAGICVLMSSRAWRLRGSLRSADLLETSGMMILVTPGIVLSTGLFLLLRTFTDAFHFAFGVVVLVNAMMALPYVIKTLHQPMWTMARQYNLLCASLGMNGWRRFLIVEWRAIRKPVVHAFVISFLVSMGDLSAIALFGSQDFKTLPLYLYQLMGSYQMEAAAVVALFLLLMSVGCFWGAEKLFRTGGKSIVKA
nr:thiamine/thiamine pyrophosphate ABC transporter permease [Vibrio quintilis]